MRTILGLDIGGTKTAVLEGTGHGEILQRIELATYAERPVSETFPRIDAAMRQVIEVSHKANREIWAISVSIGGPLKIEEGFLIDPPHLPGWFNMPLKKHIESLFPGYPVYVEHDGNAGALAEFHFGVGKDHEDLQHLIFLTFGTGLGGGFIVNGKVLRGASDTAGEVGHWRLSEQGPVGFGKTGSWEGLASGAALIELAHLKNPARWPKDTPIRDVVEAILAADDEALQVANEAGYWMGRGIALLVDALNPQIVVLGSLSVVLGDRILDPVREVVAREALPQAVRACTIRPAALGKQIGDVASLMGALSRVDR